MLVIIHLPRLLSPIEVTNTHLVTFVLNEKSRSSVRLGACGRVDVYSIVRLWPELLASF